MRFLKTTLKVFLREAVPYRLKRFIFWGAYSIMTDKEVLRLDTASMEWSLENLKRLGFSPAKVIDVGAYEGTWTRMVKKIFPDARVLMIEPQARKGATLEKLCARYPGSVVYSMSLVGPEERDGVRFVET